MTIYKAKKSIKRSAISIFIFLAMITTILSFLYGDIKIFAVAGVFIFFAIIFKLVVPPEIITDINGIKRKMMGRLFQESRWDWINAVETIRGGAGHYITYLYYSPGFEKSDSMIKGVKSDKRIVIYSFFTNYIELLKEVKDKAVNAEFDKETEKILKEGIENRSVVRKILLTIAFFIFAGLIGYAILHALFLE